jgi:prefoldin alpha subunit
MNNDEELSRCMAQIEQYKEQMNTLEMQSSYLQAAILEYNKAKMTLEQLSKVDKDVETLIPIGGGVFIDAKSNKESQPLVDIGSGYVTSRTYQETIKKIDVRIENLEKTQEKIVNMMQQIQSDATELSAKAQKLMSNQKTN